MRRVLVVLALALFAQPAFAEGPKGPNAEGEYGGVKPGQPRKADPGKKPRKPPPKGTLSWIGFEAKDGRGELFFQSVAPFEITQRVEGSTLVAQLHSLSRLGPNTWRYIDTRFFETAVAKVVAKKTKKGIEVRITFKDAKDAKQAGVRTRSEDDGTYYATMVFEGGTTTVPRSVKDPEK
jgi:hypothetical protein